MASGQSEVSICNLALSHLGEEPITSLDDNVKAARECSRLYDITRDMELRAHLWNFAIRRASLAKDTTDPTWGHSNRYQIPDDCLKVVEVKDDVDWHIEAGNLGDTGQTFIVTDTSAPLYIRYVSRVEDPALFDPLFINALAARLAMKLALPLTQSNTITQGARDAYRSEIQQATAQNAIESSPRPFRQGSWLTARWQDSWRR